MRTSSKVAIWNRALAKVGETNLVESEEEDRPAAELCRLHYDDALDFLLGAHVWSWAIRQTPITQIDTQTYTWAYADGVTPWTHWRIPYPYTNLAAQLTVTHIDSSDVETVLSSDDGDFTLVDVIPGGFRQVVVLDSALTSGESLRLDLTYEREGWEHVYAVPSDLVKPIALLADGERLGAMNPEDREPFELQLYDDGETHLLCTDYDEDDFEVLQYVSRDIAIVAFPQAFIEALVWRLASEIAYPLTKKPQVEARCEQRAMLALTIAIDRSENDRHEDEPTTPSLNARG